MEALAQFHDFETQLHATKNELKDLRDPLVQIKDIINSVNHNAIATPQILIQFREALQPLIEKQNELARRVQQLESIRNALSDKLHDFIEESADYHKMFSVDPEENCLNTLLQSEQTTTA